MADERKVRRARRGYGEGSVFQRADGRWVGQIRSGHDAEGKRIRRAVYGRTKREALDKLDELRRKAIPGVGAARRWTVAEWLDHWLEEIAKPGVVLRTWDGYERHVRLHVRPAPIARVRLDALTAPQVRSWLRWLEDTGRGRASRQWAYRVLRQSLKAAVADRMIPANPMEHVKAHGERRRAMEFLDADAARKLLAEIEGHRLRGVFVLALYTGMRQGEIFGLQWENVDLDESRLRVEHNLVDRKGTLTLGPPKNEASRRTIVLPEPAVEALRERRVIAMREGHAGSPFVFTGQRGGPVDRSNCYRFVWEPIRDDLGLAVRFHDLRHTAATLMLQAGAPVKAVSEMLGHSSAAMTLDVYAHTLDGMREAAAAAMTAALATQRLHGDAETA